MHKINIRYIHTHNIKNNAKDTVGEQKLGPLHRA